MGSGPERVPSCWKACLAGRDRGKEGGWACPVAPAFATGVSVWAWSVAHSWDLTGLGPGQRGGAPRTRVTEFQASRSGRGSLSATALLCVLWPFTDLLWPQFPHQHSMRLLQLGKQTLQIGPWSELSLRAEMIAQKPSTSTLTARLGAGMAGAVEGSAEDLAARDSMSGAAASAPGKPAGGLSTEGADSQAGGNRSGVVLRFPGRAAVQG